MTEHGIDTEETSATAAMGGSGSGVVLLRMLLTGPDAAFVLLYANTNAHDLLRKDLTILLGTTVDTSFPELFDRKLLELCSKALRTQQTLRPEQGVSHADGGMYGIRLVPLSDDEVALLIEAGTTPSHNTKALTLLEKDFGMLLNAMPDAIIITDGKGTMQLVNHQAEHVFGYSRKEMVGQPVEMLMPLAVRGKHRDHRWRYAQRPALRLMGQGRELLATRKDGTEFQVEIALSPIDLEGSSFTLAAVRDLTSRRTAQEAQRKLEAILASSPDAIVSKDLNGLITAWNPGAEQMFGYSEKDVLGTAVTTYVPGDQQLMEYAAERTVLDRGEVQRFESVRQHKDGTLIDVAVTVSPIRDDRGVIVGISKMVKSIAARKHAEMQLHELNRTLEQRILERSEDLVASEKRYHDTLDKMLEGVQFISADWRYMYVNDALVAQSNVRRDHMIGHTMMEVFPGIEHTPVFRTMQDCMADGTARNIDNDFVFPDGHSRSYHLSIQPMDNGIFILSKDITQRKQVEQALRTSEARYHNALDVLIEGAQILGRDWQHLYVNDAMVALSTFTKKELLGATFLERYPEVQHRVVFKELERCMLERCTHTMECEFTFRKGTTKSVYLRIQPVDEGLFLLFQDITERKLAELELATQRSKLKEQNRELEQFTYIASHDLQEPLRMVTSYVELLQRRYVGKLDADADEFIHFAVDGAKRMKQLIDDLLAYSRIGRVATVQPVDMNRIVKQAIANLGSAIAESGARLHIEELPMASGSPTDMLQVMQNLIGNALKFRRANTVPEVWVKGRNEGPHSFYAVSDNGIGIEPAYKEQIFAPFKRLHGRSVYAGSGIGLAIAQKVVERYGGRIWVTSVPGEGSTFQFTIEQEQQ